MLLIPLTSISTIPTHQYKCRTSQGQEPTRVCVTTFQEPKRMKYYRCLTRKDYDQRTLTKPKSSLKGSLPRSINLLLYPRRRKRGVTKGQEDLSETRHRYHHCHTSGSQCRHHGVPLPPRGRKVTLTTSPVEDRRCPTRTSFTEEREPEEDSLVTRLEYPVPRVGTLVRPFQ